MRFLYFAICSLITHSAAAQTTLYEASSGNQTAPYPEIIGFYEALAETHEHVKLLEKGLTDSGFPLHLTIYDQSGAFDSATWKLEGKKIVFINNGIHPGEPAGIDASMMLLRDLAEKKFALREDIILAIIPVYNIGGHLNRNSTTRVNQNGPEEYGFRGNARNYDLNRDFIKADTRNAASFHEIFHFLSPLVFIDTHTSNGADYQHIMTLIPTQHDRMAEPLGSYLKTEMIPFLFEKMEEREYPLVPYVNAWGGPPENGWVQFKDGPRYSSGYASLFHTLSFMPEAHMLKSYKDRVESMYALLQVFLEKVEKDGDKILALQREAKEQTRQKPDFGFNHIPNREEFELIKFLGFESGTKKSLISGQDRLYYDRSKPFEAEVKYYNTYEPSLTLSKPQAYIIPQGWHNVIRHLERNKVSLKEIKADTMMKVQVYHIEDFETSKRAYEGHFNHSKVKVSKEEETVLIKKGDILLEMNQESNRFVMEVLEPQAEDSFFSWNYFDMILQAKEGYSAYVFEDLAATYLDDNPELKNELEELKANDPEFADNGAAQLRWVFENSPWKEKAHNRYPIYRIEN
ncbi:M14 family metallopeptidase [Litoribacter alkaliphilus]|uniref:M14 family metallopeptidase n=1 Tax=Litoribacter ruber TaxID=702568 RepID=A0AAP2CF96_9BACT|nr:M14 family metallopeptidase [Litoribacter alkaliphilus]MBS9523513.1 M14 family metallopeptidase [Litoribacter alkaliphilus]